MRNAVGALHAILQYTCPVLAISLLGPSLQLLCLLVSVSNRLSNKSHKLAAVHIAMKPPLHAASACCTTKAAFPILRQLRALAWLGLAVEGCRLSKV